MTRWYSVCGIHRSTYPVKRCELCRAHLAELRAESPSPLRAVLTGEVIEHPLRRATARKQALAAAVRRARGETGKPARASSNPLVMPRVSALRGRE